MLTTVFTAEQTEAEALELERRASQLRGINRQRREALKGRLAAARQRLNDLHAARMRSADVQRELDSDATVRAAHQSFIAAQTALTGFLKRYLPRHVPGDKEGELAQLREAAIAAEADYRSVVESVNQHAIADKLADIDAEAATLQREVADFEGRLAAF